MEVTKKGAAKNTIFWAGKRARGGLERSEAGILPKFVQALPLCAKFTHQVSNNQNLFKGFRLRTLIKKILLQFFFEQSRLLNNEFGEGSEQWKIDHHHIKFAQKTRLFSQSRVSILHFYSFSVCDHHQAQPSIVK